MTNKRDPSANPADDAGDSLWEIAPRHRMKVPVRVYASSQFTPPLKTIAALERIGETDQGKRCRSWASGWQQGSDLRARSDRLRGDEQGPCPAAVGPRRSGR